MSENFEDVETTDDGVMSTRVSRRTVIAGTAGAAAAMWAAPAITTLGSRAAAVTGSQVCPRNDWTCGATIVACGSTGPLALCVCDVDTDGNPFCWEDFYCADVSACASNQDCPSGYRCVTSCCGKTCAPICGTNRQTLQSSGARGSKS